MKIFLLILLLFIAVDVLIVGYVIYRRMKKKLSPGMAEKVREQWKKIIREPDHRHAVLEADKLLDFALTKMGYSGNLGQKLKSAPRLFSDLNALWSAHKIRNNIAHQMNYQVNDDAYKKTMLAFKKAFQDLKIF